MFFPQYLHIFSNILFLCKPMLKIHKIFYLQENSKRTRKHTNISPVARPGQIHIRTALDGTFLFYCPECSMSYSDKALFEQHLVVHNIERRFICELCGAGFKQRRYLKPHKLSHSEERPFVCNICCKGIVYFFVIKFSVNF